MTKIGYLTCSNCQHDKEDTERAREVREKAVTSACWVR